jgi:hypothetical protein
MIGIERIDSAATTTLEGNCRTPTGRSRLRSILNILSNLLCWYRPDVLQWVSPRGTRWSPAKRVPGGLGRVAELPLHHH